jgi:hypothetical protein
MVHHLAFEVLVGRGVNEQSFDRFAVSFQRKRNRTIKDFYFVSLTKRLTQIQFISSLKQNGWRNSSVSWSFLSLFRYSFHMAAIKNLVDEKYWRITLLLSDQMGPCHIWSVQHHASFVYSLLRVYRSAAPPFAYHSRYQNTSALP